MPAERYARPSRRSEQRACRRRQPCVQDVPCYRPRESPAASEVTARVNLRAASEVLFALGRRHPRLPVAFPRAMPLSSLHALRCPALRETFTATPRARRGTATPSPPRASTSGGLAVPRTSAASFSRRRSSRPGLRRCWPARRTRHRELRHLRPRDPRLSEPQGARVHTRGRGGLTLGLYGLGATVTGSSRRSGLDWGLGSLLVEAARAPHAVLRDGRRPGRSGRGLPAARRIPFQRGRERSLLAGAPDRHRARAGPPGAAQASRRGREGASRPAPAPSWSRSGGAGLHDAAYASTEAATILGFECTHRGAGTT